jgi:hypothetical protein
MLAAPGSRQVLLDPELKVGVRLDDVSREQRYPGYKTVIESIKHLLLLGSV